MDIAPPSPGPHPSESEILPGLLAGERVAFEKFVRKFCDPMYYVARRIVRNDDDAREVMQDAFLRAFKGMAAFEGRSQLSTWLHRIVINAALKKWNSRQRAAEQPIESLLPHFRDGEHHQVEPKSFQSPVEEFAMRREMKSLVHRQIDLLPDSYRTVVLLRDIEGLDTEEAAALLGTTANVVKTRLHRARQALRTLLEPYFQEAQP